VDCPKEDTMESKQESAAWASVALKSFLERCVANVRFEYMARIRELPSGGVIPAARQKKASEARGGPRA